MSAADVENRKADDFGPVTLRYSARPMLRPEGAGYAPMVTEHFPTNAAALDRCFELASTATPFHAPSISMREPPYDETLTSADINAGIRSRLRAAQSSDPAEKEAERWEVRTPLLRGGSKHDSFHDSAESARARAIERIGELGAGRITVYGNVYYVQDSDD